MTTSTHIAIIKTVIDASRHSMRAQFANTGRVFSSESLRTIEGIEDIPELIHEPPHEDCSYGWRKLRPSVVREANGDLWFVETRFLWGQWPAAMYGAIL